MKKTPIVVLLSLPFMPLGTNYFYLGHTKKALFYNIVNLILFLSLVASTPGVNTPQYLQSLGPNNIYIQTYAFIVLMLHIFTMLRCLKIIKKPNLQIQAHFYTSFILAMLFVSLSFAISVGTNSNIFHASLFGFRSGNYFQPIFFLVLIAMFIWKSMVAIKKPKENKRKIIYQQVTKTDESQPANTHEPDQTEPQNPIIATLVKMTSDLEQSYKKFLGTDIHNQIYDLYATTKKITDFIEKYPHKSRSLVQFVEYYLPTTIKLIDNYKDLLDQGVGGENITKSKKKIKELLTNLQTAYDNQLDSLFEDKALDIDAEISVMNNLLKQQGLIQ